MINKFIDDSDGNNIYFAQITDFISDSLVEDNILPFGADPVTPINEVINITSNLPILNFPSTYSHSHTSLGDLVTTGVIYNAFGLSNTRHIQVQSATRFKLLRKAS